MIDEKKYNLFAVSGHPIAHSFSPEIFKIISKLANYNENSEYLRLGANNIEEIFHFAKELPLRGLNTSMPFKKDFFSFFNANYKTLISKELSKLKAINSFTIKDESFNLYNSDFFGLKSWIAQLLQDNSFTEVLILGAGDSASAAILALVANNYKQSNICLFSRDPKKAKQKFKNLKISYFDYSSLSAKNNSSNNKLIISTLPQSAKKSITELDLFFNNSVIIDTLYHDSFLINIIPDNIEYYSGLYWLASQAIALWEFFTNKTIDKQITIKKIVSELEEIKSSKNKNISLIGYMGAGKSTIGKKIALKLDYEFIDLDEFIKNSTNKSPAEIIRTDGEAYFRKVESKYLNYILNNKNKIVLSCGGGVILSNENRKLLKNSSFPIWLYVSYKSSAKRIMESSIDRPVFNDKDHKNNYSKFLKRQLLYAKTAKLVIDNEYNSIESSADLIYFELSKLFGLK